MPSRDLQVFFSGSIKCIPEGPGQLRSGMIFFCGKSPTIGDKLLSNFPRGRDGAMGRGSFHAKVLVLFIINDLLPLELIKKKCTGKNYCSLQLVKKINH